MQLPFHISYKGTIPFCMFAAARDVLGVDMLRSLVECEDVEEVCADVGELKELFCIDPSNFRCCTSIIYLFLVRNLEVCVI